MLETSWEHCYAEYEHLMYPILSLPSPKYRNTPKKKHQKRKTDDECKNLIREEEEEDIYQPLTSSGIAEVEKSEIGCLDKIEILSLTSYRSLQA